MSKGLAGNYLSRLNIYISAHLSGLSKQKQNKCLTAYFSSFEQGRSFDRVPRWCGTALFHHNRHRPQQEPRQWSSRSTRTTARTLCSGGGRDSSQSGSDDQAAAAAAEATTFQSHEQVEQ